MNILLFGEYSGLFNCLKDGFKELGHQVFLASDGDSHKDYPSDFRWDKNVKGKAGKIVSIFNVFSNLNKFRGYDIVFLISPYPLYRRYFNDKIFDFLIENNKQVYLCGAGLNPHSFDFWNKTINTKYHTYTQNYLDEAKQLHKKVGVFNNLELQESETKLFEKIAGYIPIMYEYAEPYRYFPQLIKTIPIPINTSKYIYRENTVKNKIVFFHGLSRVCKGGEYILKAFEILSKKYPHDADFFCKGGLPFNDYIQLLQRTNVVLDDANAYSLGMNALFSMAQGKIVMGGAEDVAAKELEYTFCPAINISSNVNQIINAVEMVIENRKDIEEIGYNSRSFVELFHDHQTIAQKYINLWDKLKH
jgi:glycosyltransferase involved in cell wall biosynthesis